MTLARNLSRTGIDEDHVALQAACEDGTGLCTVVGIDGSFSRRLGAQLAIVPGGAMAGSLSDGCLEAQLAADMRGITEPTVVRYGHGSAMIDFRLPCGGGLDILLDPAPDRADCGRVLRSLAERHPAALALPHPSPLRTRQYFPRLRIVATGEGPELDAFRKLGEAAGAHVDIHPVDAMSLGEPPDFGTLDRWTAVLLLFHDHEWEKAILANTLSSDAFYIGAQGGENARVARILGLSSRGVSESDIARITSPVGLIPGCKSPQALALSALAEIVGEYEQLRAAS